MPTDATSRNPTVVAYYAALLVSLSAFPFTFNSPEGTQDQFKVLVNLFHQTSCQSVII